MGGRERQKRGPRKLNKEVEEIILRNLRAGSFARYASEAAGITHRTFKDWLERGEAGERPYAAFALKVMKVRANDANRAQSIITRAQLGKIDGDWKAAAWNLERKYPKEYGQAALQAAAAVTVRTGSPGPQSDDHGATTTVQFYLPDNGRRPQDEEA